MLTAMLAHAERLKPLKRVIEQTLEELQTHDVFTPPQGVGLAAAVFEYRPTVIIDLGTGSGGSCSSLALAAPGVPVYTFDINANWDDIVAPKLRESPEWDQLKPYQADITKFDFAPLVAGAERVMVFWDAHGFSVAARVFSHIMPLIADKPHIVVCHDMSDVRTWGDDLSHLSYKGKRMWRGTEDYFENFADTAQLILGWMETPVEQGIVIQDFCYRNRIELRTFDQDVHVEGVWEEREKLREALFPEGVPGFHLTYFTMNKTALRNFPSG